MRFRFEILVETIIGVVLDFFLATYKASASAKLVKLCDRVYRIRALLEDADQYRKIDRESVLLWLGELRSIVFDTEDLTEEFEARALSFTGVSHWEILRSIWYYRCVKSRVDKINKRYDATYGNMARLRKYNRAPIIPRLRGYSVQTGSFEGTIPLWGRHEENELLRKLLLQDSNSTRLPPVISITGEGGIGKTALARSAFNHPEIRKHFEHLIWISLHANPDPVEIIKKVIEAINGTDCNLSALDVHNLQQLLMGKKFLLVLDGVYTDTKDVLFGDILCILLTMAHPGSRVLATTRNQTTAQNMGSSDQVALTGLNPHFLWMVLKSEAFPQTPYLYKVPENLESIGKEIAEKCYGAPLVAKLLGRVLCGITNEEDWNNILQGLPNQEVFDNILPFLKLSYDLLPLHLKRCIAYCSIFPKGYEFDREYLVKLWMSEGLLNSECRNARTLEDIGRRQFNDLLWRSFFQPCGLSGDCDRYVMPGAIHDLIKSVSMYECVRVDYSVIQRDKRTMARYAFLCEDHLKHELLNNIYDKEHLRTLIIHTVGLEPVKNILQQDLSSNLKCLRSLDLSKCKVDNLHESIGNLIHLRYLNLRDSLFETLPESICNLLNLQTLILDECYNLKELPKEMSSFFNMRHIGLSLNWEHWDGKDFDSMPPKLGMLTSLQTLSRFVVAKLDGCGITELRNLNLHGNLCISKLENVKDGNDARDANLQNKVHLRDLLLRWSSRKSFDSVNEEEVIRQLSPPNAIKCICIEGYNGSEFPVWVTEPSFRHLEIVKLLNCKICIKLPQLATLPQLKCLYLLGLDKVRDLNYLFCKTTSSVRFPSLELLHLSDMPVLENWFVVPNGSLTKLHGLSISNCPKLKHISYLPLSLMRFELRNCRALKQLPTTVPSLSNLIVEGVDSKIIEWVQNLTSLTSLSIIKIPELRHINGGNLKRLSGLTMLKIDGCNKLESIERNGGLQDLLSLKKLEISCCARLQSFSDQGLPHQIEELHLKGLESLNALPSGLDQLGHLHTLELCDLPKLSSVPMLRPLHFLSINECPKLEKRSQMGGKDLENMNLRFAQKLRLKRTSQREILGRRRWQQRRPQPFPRYNPSLFSRSMFLSLLFPLLPTRFSRGLFFPLFSPPFSSRKMTDEKESLCCT